MNCCAWIFEPAGGGVDAARLVGGQHPIALGLCVPGSLRPMSGFSLRSSTSALSSPAYRPPSGSTAALRDG